MPKPSKTGSPPASLELVKEPHSPRGLVPASSCGRLDTAYNAYLDSLELRSDSPKSKAVEFALASARDERFRVFLERLSSPLCKRWSLATIAKTCEISLPEWAEFWQKATVQRALAKAQDALPNLADDLIEDARSRIVGCERCGGRGTLKAECPVCANQVTDCPHCNGKGIVESCPDCDGTGKQRKPGDVDARRMLLDMTGLGGRKAPAVQINQTFSSGIGSAMDKMSKVTFDVEVEAEPQTPD